MRQWIESLTEPVRFRPRFLLATATGITIVFFAVIAVNIWAANRQIRHANRSLLALEQLVGTAIDLHARRVHALFEAVSRRDPEAENSYHRMIAELDHTFLSFREIPRNVLIAGNLSNGLSAHSRLKLLEAQALERVSLGDADSAMIILFSPQHIQAEDDFHNSIHGADETLSRQRDILAERFTNRLLFIALISSGFILLLTGGWIIIVLLTRKYYLAHTRSQSALQESELKYRRLIDTLPHAVMIVQDMTIQFCNPAAMAVLGFSKPEQLLGAPLESILAEKDRQRVRDIAKAREQGEKDVPDHYFVSGLRADHEEFPAEVFVRPIQYRGRFAVQAVILDVTDRQRAEDALRESEERFRNLADLAPVLIWMAGVKRHTYYLNRTWLNFTGRGIGQEYGQGWQQGVHPEDLPRLQHTYDSAFASRSPFTIEYRLRHADGTFHWVLDTGVPRFTSEHQFTGYIGSCVDISARLEAEQALRDNEARFRTLYNKTPAMLHSVDKEGRIVSVSDYWLEVMGYERNEVIGKPAANFDTPEYRKLAEDKYLPEFLKTNQLKNLPYQLVTKSGQVIDTILSLVAEQDAAGHVARALAVNTDVSELRRAESAIRVQAKIIDEMHDGVVTTDLNAHITSWNKGAEKLYGYSANEVLGKHIGFIYSDPSSLDSQVVVPLLRDGSHDAEVRLKRKSGEEFDAQIFLSCSYDAVGNVQGMIGYSRDITERKQAEAALNFRMNFEILTTAIANRFINVPYEAIDDEIQRTLEETGRFMEVDRSYVFLLRDDGRVMDNTHEWCAPGIQSEMAALQNIDIDESFPWFAKHMRTLQTVVVPQTSLLPPEAAAERRELERENIQSLIMVPFSVSERYTGFIGFDSVRSKRAWNDDSIALLRMIGDIVVSAIARRRAESTLHRVNRALRTISDCNQVLVRTDDEQTLLKEICRVIVETGGYYFAWVGFPDDNADKTVTRAAFAGFEDGFLSEIKMTWADAPLGQGPVGTALRTGELQVIRDLRTAERFEPWREMAIRRGYRSTVALPLIANGKILGGLGIYSVETEAFSEAEINLLTELADDLAFGISAMRIRAEHEQVLQALVESEEQFRTLFETMDQGVVYQDRNGRIIRANPAAERILGLSLDEMNGKTSTDRVWGAIREDGTPFPGEMHPSMVALLTGVPVHHIIMGILNRRDEQIHWIEVDAVPQFRPDESEPYQVYTVFSDITDRRQADLALKHSHNLMRYIIEHNRSAVAVHDKDLKYIYVSQRYLDDYNVKEKDVIGKHHYDVFPDLPQKWRDVHQKALTGVISSAEDDPYVREDGSVDWTRWECRPWYEADGAIGGIIVYTEVITARKQAEDALRQSEERFSKAFSASPVAIAVTRMSDGKILEANNSAEKFFEYGHGEVIGMTTKDLGLWTRVEDRNQMIADLAAGVPVHDREYSFTTKSGKHVFTRYSAETIEIGKEPCLLSAFVDITEQKLSEDALRESEERYRGIYTTAPLAFVLWDRECRITDWNKRAEDLLGWTRTEVIGKNFFDLIIPESARPQVQAVVARLQKGELPSYNINENLTKDGRIIICEWNNVIQYDAAGNWMGAISLGLDITERKQAEDALRESEERLRAIVDSAPFGAHLYELQPDNRLVFTGANKAADRILGLENAQFVGKTIEEAFPPLEKTDIPQQYRHVARTGEQYETDQVDYDEGGIRGAFEIHAFHTGRNRMAVFFRDITERKKAEDALRAKTEELNRFFDVNLDLLCIADTNGNFHRMNRAWESTLGYTLADLEGKKFFDFIHPDDIESTAQAVSQLADGKDVLNFTNRYRCRDGSYRWIEWRSTPREGGFIYAAARDITERIRAEEELRNERWRLASIIEGTHIGTWEWNVQTGETTFNETWAQLCGYTLEELAPIDVTVWERLTHPDDLKKAYDELERHFSGELPYYDCEMRMQHKDGNWIWIHDRGRVITRTADGKPLMMFGTHTDITERKQAEEELRQSEERYRNFIFNASEGIYRIDLVPPVDIHQQRDVLEKEIAQNAVTGEVNQALADMYGLNPDEMTGRMVRDFAPNCGTQMADLLEQKNFQISEREEMEFTESGEPIYIVESYTGVVENDKLKRVWGVQRNVTERKKAEMARRALEEKFRNLFDNMAEGVVLHEVVRDKAGRIVNYRIVDANPRVSELTGVQRDAVIGKLATEAYGTNEPPYLEQYAGLFATNQPLHFETFFPPMDKHFAISAAPIGTDSFATIFSDVSDRVKNERELREANLRRQALFEHARDAIFIADPDTGLILDVNHEAERLIGRPRDELIGMHQTKMHPPEKLEHYIQMFQEDSTSDRIGPAEVEVISANGELIPVEITASLIEFPGGKRVVQGLFRNVSERYRTEAAIRERQGKLDAIFRAAPTGIGVVVSRVITEANDTLCEITGYFREELIGQSARMLYPTDEDFDYVGREKYRQIAEKGTGTVETRWQRKDGTIVNVLLSSSPIMPEDLQQGVTFTALDITDRKRAAEELERRATELQRSNAELERFAYVASHDLQEPLRMMASYAQLLEQRYKDRLDTDASEFIGFITDGAERMRQLIRDLLTFSRVDTRAKPFRKVDCQDVFNKVLTDLRVAIEEAQAVVTAEPLPTITADDTQLSQLLRNLINNAIKFRTKEAPQVHVAATESDGHWQFSVRDNGIGIDPKYFDQVFVIFKRLHGRNEYPGTGIGLAVCKKIVERHGGRIWVESAPGQGTTIFFTIPKQRPAEGRTRKDGR